MILIPPAQLLDHAYMMAAPSLSPSSSDNSTADDPKTCTEIPIHHCGDLCPVNHNVSETCEVVSGHSASKKRKIIGQTCEGRVIRRHGAGPPSMLVFFVPYFCILTIRPCFSDED